MIGMIPQARILIVEDEMPVALLMEALLTRAGCEVKVASTGRMGMELAQEERFDLIALDIDLPDVCGFEICRELKQRHISYRTPVIFISGRGGEEDQQNGRDMGAADYIVKPFDVLDFVPRLLSHVRRCI
jgi:DNA-binding response OmpR family regulator